MVTVGVDPGLGGAVALLSSSQAGRSLTVWDIPTTEVRSPGRKQKKQRVLDEDKFADLVINLPEHDSVWIEKVHSMPDQGVASQFSFGMVYGAMRMAFIYADVAPFYTVTPQRWKLAMGCGADKESSLVACLNAFPQHNTLWFGPRQGVLDGRCEAALIALYGERHHEQRSEE